MVHLHLDEDLRVRARGERLVLVEHLLSQNEDPVPLLCSYLGDPRLRIQIIAAKTLAEIGDERALEPLCRAMDTNTRRLPLWLARSIQCLSFLGLGVLLGVIVMILAVGFHWLATNDQGAWLGFSLVSALVFPLAWSVHNGLRDRLRALWLDLLAGIGGQDDLVRSAADALYAIANRTQGATVRKCLPLLRRVRADRLIHSRATREAAARASARIQMTTAAVRRLPIACVERRIATDELPIAAGGVEPDHEWLQAA